MTRRLLPRIADMSLELRVWAFAMVVGLSLHLYKPGEIPIGMDYDQVREAFQAGRLLQHFTTIIDNLLFIHLLAIGWCQKICGLGLLSNHVNALCWFLLALFPLYWLSRDLFGSLVARWGLALTGCSILGFTATRVAHIAITTPFFAFLSLWAAYRLLRSGHLRYAWLLGLSLGLGFYSSPTFKAVFMTLPLFLVCLMGVEQRVHPRQRLGWRYYAEMGSKFLLSGLLFLAVVWGLEFGVTSRPFSLQRLEFVLVGYKSNGQFISSITQFIQNGAALLSQVLPVRYVQTYHLIIPRSTGSAEAHWYLSPLVSLALVLAAMYGLIAGWRCWRNAVTYTQKLPYTPGSGAKFSQFGWRREYDGLFALCVLLGGVSAALLSDNVGARRWIYAWFWLYPLAAFGIVQTTRRYGQKLLIPVLIGVFSSQCYLIYDPYLKAPWRAPGPTPAVVRAINAHCDSPIYATALLSHWLRHYQHIIPLRCPVPVLHNPPEPREFLYLVANVENNYSVRPFGSAALSTITCDPQQPIVTERFRDQWGFHDYTIITVFPDGQKKAAPYRGIHNH